MDLSRLESRLASIEDHVEHLRRIEDLLERTLQSQQNSEQYLEDMWEIYQQTLSTRQQ